MSRQKSVLTLGTSRDSSATFSTLLDQFPEPASADNSANTSTQGLVSSTAAVLEDMSLYTPRCSFDLGAYECQMDKKVDLSTRPDKNLNRSHLKTSASAPKNQG